MDDSLASAAHQIAEQVWPLFKRLPKTIYHILVVNDHYDDQFNFFLRSTGHILERIPILFIQCPTSSRIS